MGSHTNALAFDKARKIGRIATFRDINKELEDVFTRPRFDKYVSLEDRIGFLSLLDRQFLLWPEPQVAIQASRDPKDDKYLTLAVSCRASCIITGDKDLLVLHPFKNIPIITAADFLKRF